MPEKNPTDFYGHGCHGAMHSLLDELEDCTIECADGQVRASTFVLVQSSEIFAQLFEDMLDHDEQTERTFSAPNIQKHTMKCVVDLWSKKRSTSSLTDVDEILDVLEAMRYLASDAKRAKVVSRLWNVVRGTDKADELHKVALVVFDQFHTDLLHRVRMLTPLWKDFRVVFEHLEIDLVRAQHIVMDLMASYPVVVVIHHILEKTCADHRRDVMISCLSVPRIGLYIHPDEYYVLLDMLLATGKVNPGKIKATADDSGWEVLSRVCLESCRDVNLPVSSTKVSGSVISFQTRSRISVFVHIKHRTSKIKFSGVQVNIEGQGMDLDVDVYKFDRDARDGRAYVRVIPLYGFGVDDVEWGRTDDELWLETTVDEGKIVCTHPNSINHPEMLRYVRIDCYWGPDPRV
jgi:hypothetical protein